MSMRRTLTIAAIAIVAAGIGVLVYFYFFSQPSLTATDGPSTENPFPVTDTGTTGTLDNPSQIETLTEDTGLASQSSGASLKKLTKVTDGPVALGSVAFDVSTEDASVASGTPATTLSDIEIRFVDRTSGNLFSYKARSGVSTRISNKTLPGVIEAAWLSNGSMGYLRYLSSDQDGSEHIETYALSADGSGGYFLARDLSQVITVGSSTVFSLLPSTNGSVGTLAKSDGSGARTLFSSALSNIRVLAGANGTYVAETKPSGRAVGYAFLINGATGEFSRLAGPTSGLSTLLSPSGEKLLMSFVDTSGLHLSVLDIKTHATISLPLSTFAEKCVWASDSTYVYCATPTALPGATLPDDWYQGVVSFSDRIWKIDLAARVASLVADLPQLTDTSLDAVGLTLDPKGMVLAFMNKSNGSFWVYQL